MNFQFVTASNIIFGAGEIKQLDNLISEKTRSILLVTRRNQELPDELNTKFYDRISRYEVSGEPDIRCIEKGIEIARENKAEMVIGYGGGSVIDAGKAISALATNLGEILDYLEVVGLGKKLEKDPLPYIAIPTTAGTGSEVTKNAVISVPQKKVKVSLRSESMLPSAAIIDPQLTLSMPENVTASTGMDAFAQVLEPYVSKKHNTFTDLFCMEGIRKGYRSLIRAYQNGNDIEARTEMSWVSLLGGLSLANAGLGASHGIAGPFGGEYHAPHGAVVARLLPEVVRVNISALKTRAYDHIFIDRYLHAFQLMSGKDNITVEKGIDMLRELCETLSIPALSQYGIQTKDIPDMVNKSQVSSSMKANPIKLTDEEVAEIISSAL